MLSVQNKKIKINAFFRLSGFLFINWDHPQNKLPMMFNMFVNMFWRAEGFGYMWVPFEFGSFNIYFWYLVLSNKKLI